MTNDDNISISSDHFLEIRYEPMGFFLNLRGYVADHIKERELFKHWRIHENAVTFWNMDQPNEDTETGMVGFRNCQYRIHNPPTQTYFSEKIDSYLSALDKVDGFGFPPVLRLGVRAQFYRDVHLEFNLLRDLYNNKIFGDRLEEAFKAEIDDVGANLNFKYGNVHLNTTSGPMLREQFVQLFSPVAAKDSLSKVGLYLNIDCFKLDLGQLGAQALITQTKELHRLCRERLDSLVAFLELPEESIDDER